MAITAMALLQQHDARRDILIEPAARWRAATEARGHSELGRSELGAQSDSGNQPACLLLFFGGVVVQVVVCRTNHLRH